MVGTNAFSSSGTPACLNTSETGITAFFACIIVAVPTSYTCRMAGALPLRYAAMPAASVWS